MDTEWLLSARFSEHSRIKEVLHLPSRASPPPYLCDLPSRDSMPAGSGPQTQGKGLQAPGSLLAPTPGRRWHLADEFDSQRSSPEISGVKPRPPPSPQTEGLTVGQGRTRTSPGLTGTGCGPGCRAGCFLSLALGCLTGHTCSPAHPRVSRRGASSDGAVGRLQGLQIQPQEVQIFMCEMETVNSFEEE